MRLRRLDFIAVTSRSSSLGLMLLVVGCLLSAAAVFDDSSRSEELAQLQARVKRARTAYHLSEVARGASNGPSLGDFKQAIAIEQRLAAPWGRLLDTLEQAQNDSIALLAVEPDSESGRLRLGGEAKDLPVLVAYMQSLEGKGGISHLRLVTQQVKAEDAQHPVVFLLEAQWAAVPIPSAPGRVES